MAYVTINGEHLHLDTLDGVQAAISTMELQGIAAALVRADDGSPLEPAMYLHPNGSITDDPLSSGPNVAIVGAAPVAASPASAAVRFAPKVPPGQAKKGSAT